MQVEKRRIGHSNNREKFQINEVKEIVSTLDKNDELNRKPLKKIKTEKINYLNFKPKSPSPSEENK